MLQGYLICGAAGLALSVGAFFYGRNVESDIQEARYTKALLAETEKTLAAERKYQELSKEVEDVIKPKLARAEHDAVSVARRLREYKARSCPLSETAGASSVFAGPAGDPGEDEAIERAAEEVFGAAARDAERLRTWQEWYKSVSTQHGQ